MHIEIHTTNLLANNYKFVLLKISKLLIYIYYKYLVHLV